MNLKNEKIKSYITDNIAHKAQTEERNVEIVSWSFSEDRNFAVFAVREDIKNSYIVSFYGIIDGFFSSGCDCPHDRGSVCNHVAVAAEKLDELLLSNQLNNTSKVLTVENSKEKDNSKSDYLIINNFGSEAVLTEEFIKMYSPKEGYSESELENYDVGIIEIQKNEIHCLCSDIRYEHYFSPKDDTIEVLREGNHLKLKCSCKGLKERLCIHQVASLNYIRESISPLFFSSQYLKKEKENFLAQYGFSLDDNYGKYFNFDFNPATGRLSAFSELEGVVRTSKYINWKELVDNNIQGSNVEWMNLPFTAPDKKRKKEKMLAFCFHFPDHEEVNAIDITPVVGNANSQKTALVSKIEPVDTDNNLFENDFLTSPETISLLQLINTISDEKTESIFGMTMYDTGEKNFYKIQSYIHTQLSEILDKIEGYITYEAFEHYNYSKKNLIPIQVHKQSTDLSFKVVQEEDFYALNAYVQIGGKNFKLTRKDIGTNFLFVKSENNYYLNKSIAYSRTLHFFNSNPVIRIHKSDFENYYNEFLAPLSKSYQVEIKHIKKSKEHSAETLLKKQVYISETESYILIKPFVKYPEKLIALLGAEKLIHHNDENVLTEKKRNKTFETEFFDELTALHPDFVNQNREFFFLPTADFIKEGWFMDAFEQLKNNQIEVFGLKSLKSFKYNPNRPSISVSLKSDMDWFDVSINIAFGDLNVSLKEVQKSVLKQSNYVQLSDGSIGILPKEWVAKYTKFFRAGELKKDKMQLSKLQFSAIDSLYEDLEENNKTLLEIAEKKQKLLNFNKIEKVPVPKGITADLREYQKEGLNWLRFLDEFSFGGCLADDMGLGKTLQIITFFKYLKDRKKTKRTHLVVAPTSLIFNWKEELARFCPKLKCLDLTGINRNKNSDHFDSYDIVITSYGTALRDITYLKEYEFDYVVLDESQAIKNPNSQRYKAVRLLKANNRLALTGTPIENNTFDLYAQMNFLNPGLLGSRTRFKEQYSNFIDKNKDKNRAEELREMIAPFLLRRTKEQVATELPEKTESILYCTMGTAQRKIYDAYRNKYRNYLLKKIDDQGLEKSKIHILEGLTKLRQICDSPALLNDEAAYDEESIKISELIRHIKEKTGKHKVLVFSQFVKMLTCIKTELDKENIPYEYLDGRTKKRDQKVKNFQDNDEVRAFLISLKAGGTGLNLTQADYVYLVDPWWNPAVENQAIDRCYRIGQTRHVMAYKMICKDTIEEKIVQHQSNKKQLASDIIQTEESFMKSLSGDVIKKLFS